MGVQIVGGPVQEHIAEVPARIMGGMNVKEGTVNTKTPTVLSS